MMQQVVDKHYEQAASKFFEAIDADCDLKLSKDELEQFAATKEGVKMLRLFDEVWRSPIVCASIDSACAGSFDSSLEFA